MVCAVAGFKVLKRGDRFGGVVFDDERMDHIPVKRSRKNLQHFFNYLVTYNQALANREIKIGSKNRLNEVLPKVATAIGHDHLVVVISDFLQADDETLRHLLNLSKHNDVICARISDPLEMELPESKILLSDGDRQMLWDKHKASQSALAEHMKLSTARFHERLMKYGIVTLNFNTEEDVAAQMKKIIKKAMSR